MKKIVAALPLTVVFLLLFAGIASAHVEVSPPTALQGTFQEFTVRVPNEKEVPVVKVELDVPAEVDISGFHPAPGWTYVASKDTSGKIVKITWTATGPGLAPAEYEKFSIAGLISRSATQMVWKAHQTFKDGSTADWIGDEKSDTPAPVTIIKPVPKNVTVSDDGDIESDGSDSAAPAGSSPATLYLSIAAAAISVLALILSLRKAKR